MQKGSHGCLFYCLRSKIHLFEKTFRRTANRTLPIFGDVFPASAWCDAAVRVAFGLVVKMFAFQAVIFFVIGHGLFQSGRWLQAVQKLLEALAHQRQRAEQPMIGVQHL